MKKKLSITGMSCGNCVNHVTQALQGIEGITAVAVSLTDHEATIEASSEVADDLLKSVVAGAGYTVTAIQDQ